LCYFTSGPFFLFVCFTSISVVYIHHFFSLPFSSLFSFVIFVFMFPV
jgi:hypothetical protein